MSELLPLPLLPQIPIFSPGRMDMLRSLITRFESPLYDAETFVNSIAPCVGQAGGTDRLSEARFSLTVRSEKDLIREMAPSDVSRLVHSLIMSARISEKLMTLRIAKPTWPALIFERSLTIRIIRITAIAVTYFGTVVLVRKFDKAQVVLGGATNRKPDLQ